MATLQEELVGVIGSELAAIVEGVRAERASRISRHTRRTGPSPEALLRRELVAQATNARKFTQVWAIRPDLLWCMEYGLPVSCLVNRFIREDTVPFFGHTEWSDSAVMDAILHYRHEMFCPLDHQQTIDKYLNKQKKMAQLDLEWENRRHEIYHFIAQMRSERALFVAIAEAMNQKGLLQYGNKPWTASRTSYFFRNGGSH